MHHYSHEIEQHLRRRRRRRRFCHGYVRVAAISNNVVLIGTSDLSTNHV